MTDEDSPIFKAKLAAKNDRRTIGADAIVEISRDPSLGPLIKCPCLICPVEHICGSNPGIDQYTAQDCPLLGDWVEWSKLAQPQFEILRLGRDQQQQVGEKEKEKKKG